MVCAHHPVTKTSQFRFQHEDLVRKRAKIHQQKREMEDSTKYREETAHNARRMLSEQRNKLHRQAKQDEESIKREIIGRICNVEIGGHHTTQKDVIRASDILKREEDVQEKRFAIGLRRELSNLDLEFYEHTFPKIVGSKLDIVRAENTILDEEIERIEILILQSRRH
jgi:hypothetical protein